MAPKNFLQGDETLQRTKMMSGCAEDLASDWNESALQNFCAQNELSCPDCATLFEDFPKFPLIGFQHNGQYPVLFVQTESNSRLETINKQMNHMQCVRITEHSQNVCMPWQPFCNLELDEKQEIMTEFLLACNDN